MTTFDLLRHGEARPAAAGGDVARPLSAAGSHAIERLGRHLGGLEWRPERVYASPLLRARQTASLLLLSARVAATPETLEELAPDAAPSELMAVLGGLGVEGRHVLLVGHQPLLGDLVGWCVGSSATPFVPGQMVRVRFDGRPARGAGSVALALHPERL